jgi:hypothetical protein
VVQPRGHILLFTILINLQSLLKVYIDLEDIRLLYLCSRRELGDEYHYIFECTEFINERKLYFDFVYINRHNIIKYNNLMCYNTIDW